MTALVPTQRASFVYQPTPSITYSTCQVTRGGGTLGDAWFLFDWATAASASASLVGAELQVGFTSVDKSGPLAVYLSDATTWPSESNATATDLPLSKKLSSNETTPSDAAKIWHFALEVAPLQTAFAKGTSASIGIDSPSSANGGNISLACEATTVKLVLTTCGP